MTLPADLDTFAVRVSIGVIEALCMVATVVGNSLVIAAILKWVPTIFILKYYYL